MNSSPWTFHLHPLAWLGVLAVCAVYALLLRRPMFKGTRTQVRSFAAAMVVVVVALSWPVADLAAHWSLTALVVQRLLLTLAVPPLLIGGLPRTLVATITRPAPVDAVARACSRPPLAVVVVTAVFVATLSIGAVDAQSSSVLSRAALDIVLLAAGVVLWLPVLSPVPGTERMPALGRAGYLIVQSIVPSFLSVVWILARHPLYPAFVHTEKVAGLSPLTDQEVAGFLAKLATIAVLWTVAFVTVTRAEAGRAGGGDQEPLTWVDVERHLQRADRQRQRDPSGDGRPTPPPPGVPPS